MDIISFVCILTTVLTIPLFLVWLVETIDDMTFIEFVVASVKYLVKGFKYILSRLI